MDVTLAVLCDYATVSQEGKVSVLGIFDQVNPPSLPATIPQMFVVAIYSASPVEAGSQKQIRLVLVDADGGEVLQVEQVATVPPARRPGLPIVVNHVIGLAGVQFGRAVDHSFHILIGGEEKARIPLYVSDPARRQA
jgi:hypothetical protein